MKKTEVQQHYSDVHSLHDAGVDLTPEELARSTGGDPRDFQGVLVAQDSPALRALSRGRERYALRMAAMDEGEDGLIGFALIVRDVKRLIARLKR